MSPEEKIVRPADLARRLATLPRPLVMTNGVFDVLHRGHVDYLHRAAELGASLLVAVNSDPSARLLGKGPERPLNLAQNRAFVLAGLASVDVVTFFDTYTPVDLIRSIRPDVYVKGGDYDMEKLEETHVVRSWGGQAVAIPFVEGFSTTALIERIRLNQAAELPLRKAAFLDRDGVINKDKAYVYKWDDFEFVPGVIEGLQRLQATGHALVVVTNQSGLARGYYTEKQYQELTAQFQSALDAFGIKLAGVYHCPHHPKGSVAALTTRCECRKPAPGLILKAAQELGLSLADSLLIGDKSSDIAAARAAGVGRAYKIRSENPETGADDTAADGYFSSLLDCAIQLFPPQPPGTPT
jgi:rfaE bifunctional protein nucleotidyltransferase chain/domain